MLFKHIKTPDIYVILALGTNEATLEPVVIYENVETGAVWTRPASEFFDGRFGVVIEKPSPRTSGVLQ